MNSAAKNISEIINAPWKLYYFIKFLIFLPFYRLYFLLKKVKWQKGWRLYGKPIIRKYGKSQIMIGKYFINKNWYSCEPIGISSKTILCTNSQSARICIGDFTEISGTTIVSMNEISIGNKVLIGANTKIFDSDFHPSNPQERLKNPITAKAFPVKIGNNVFIGTGVIIQKGVTIGDNSTISAGSVLVNNIPANSVAAGNPAKVIFTYI